jgi:lysophospholipase L1-like esterase
LNETAGPKRFEVLNFGLSGLNLAASARRLERFGLPYHPDLIVYGFTVNDIEGPAYRKTETEEQVHGRLAWYARFAESPSYLMRAVWPRLLTLWELLFPRPGTMGYEIKQNYFNNPKAWSDFENQLDRLGEIGAEAGVCVHMLVHTHAIQLNALHPWRAIYEKVGAAALERGFTVTQTLPAHRGRKPADLRLSFFDAHPNAAGHELLASELRDALLALPRECRVPRPHGAQTRSD